MECPGSASPRPASASSRPDDHLQDDEDEENDETSRSATLSSLEGSSRSSPEPHSGILDDRRGRFIYPPEPDGGTTGFEGECNEEVVYDEKEEGEYSDEGEEEQSQGDGSYDGDDDYSQEGHILPDLAEPPALVVHPPADPPVDVGDIPLPHGKCFPVCHFPFLSAPNEFSQPMPHFLLR